MTRLASAFAVALVIGAAGGPAHAERGTQALTPTGLSDVGPLNGVAVEGIALPPSVGG